MSLCSLRRGWPLAILVACMTCGNVSHAFYPIGGFDQFNNRPVMIKWPLSLLDVNRDGEVFGDNDGIEVLIESGQYGFRPDEIQTVKSAFDTWEVIPTSYMAFRFATPSSTELDPILDLINYVCIFTPGEPNTGQGADIDGGVLGLTYLTFLIDDGLLIFPDNISYPLDGGEFVDADIVINGPFHRVIPGDAEVPFSLLSTLVHEVGHFIGLDHTPMSNFIETVFNGDEFNVEERVLPLRDQFGQLNLHGATPTMFPQAFFERSFGEPVKAHRNGYRGLSPESPTMQKFATRWEPHPAVAAPPANKESLVPAPPVEPGEEDVYFYFPHLDEVRAVDAENPPDWARQRPRGEKGAGGRRINFTVTYEDVELGTGIGFDHPTDGPARRATVERVLDYLDTILNEAGSCDIVFVESVVEEDGFLAAAAPGIFLEDPLPPIGPGYFSTSAISNIRQDLDPFPNVADIAIVFNFGFAWNATEADPLFYEFDMFTVILHELTHGLGFFSLVAPDGESEIADNVFSTFDRHIENGRGFDLFEDITALPEFLGTPADLTGDNGGLVFAGPAATTAYGGVFPELYAPSTYAPGSSVSHFDAGITCRAVMEPFIGPSQTRRNFAPIDVGALVDIGYANAAEPIGFVFTCDGTVELVDAGYDLAPDDIVGASYLYPRGDRDIFFNLRHEIRTQTRSDYPSIPIAGASITAWLDHDLDPTTTRVPVFNTMSGLYENSPGVNGYFNMLSILKEFETIDAQLYNASYVLTAEPLNGLNPSGGNPTTFDSMHTGAGVADERDAGDYITFFSAEVFRSDENINFESKNSLAQGTPIQYDPVRRQIVVLDGTGRSLAQVLPQRKPMFGDLDQTCPLNVITAAGLVSTRFPDTLRGFRDNVLLESALGIAATDFYYQVAPWTARLVARHGALQYSLAWLVRAAEWSLDHVIEVLIMISLVAFGVLRVRRKYALRRRAAAVAALGLLALIAFVPAASARLVNLSTPDMVAKSDAIVTGKVVSVESRLVEGDSRRVVTDVAIEIDDTAKGSLNKGANVTFTVGGGRVGNLVVYVPELPRFQKDEEVLLFLRSSGEGYKIFAGNRGKYQVKTDATGKKFVVGETPEAKSGVIDTDSVLSDGDSASRDRKAAQKEAAKGVPLDKFLDYLKRIAADQAKGAGDRE